MRRDLFEHFRRHFWRGLITVIPLALTIYVVVLACTVLESLFGGAIERSVMGPHYIPGLGLLFGIIFIYLFGLLAKRWMGKRVMQMVECFFDKIPILKSVYAVSRDLVAQLNASTSSKNSQPVLVKFDGMQIRMIGFLTSDEKAIQAMVPETSQAELVLVYFPMSYQIGGYTLAVPRSSVVPLSISFEDTMRIIFSAGLSNGVKKETNVISAPDRIKTM